MYSALSRWANFWRAYGASEKEGGHDVSCPYERKGQAGTDHEKRPGHVGSTFKGAMMTVRGSAMDITKDIQAMTTFRRNPGKFMKHLKKTKKPLVLTINGKAEAVVQDAEAYQRLLDIAALADAREGIRQGTEDVKKGRVRSAREALEMFRSNHGIPR